MISGAKVAALAGLGWGGGVTTDLVLGAAGDGAGLGWRLDCGGAALVTGRGLVGAGGGEAGGLGVVGT